MKNRLPIFIILIWLLVNNSYSQFCSYSSLTSKPNLVVNGDFELNNTGFTSQYTYIPSTTLLYEEKYTFTTDAHLVHFAWTGPSRTGTGKFMAINGAGVPLFFWNETITVKPNTNYRFSTWLKNVAIKPQYQGLAPAQIELWINNQKVSNTITLVDYPDVWKLLDTIWNSGSNTTALLGIKTVSTDGNGCDFGMDDVEFKECSCTTTSLAATNATAICLGDSVPLNATPGLSGGTYSWSPGVSLNDSTIKSPKGKPLTNTIYTVTYTLAGCSTTASVLVNVKQVSSNAGLDKNICLGDSVRLDGVAIGNFTWQPTTAMNDSTQIKPYVKPVSDTKYILKATLGSCVQIDTVEVFVSQVSSNAGLDKNICIGDSVQLNASAIGTFKWQPTTYMSDSNLVNPYVKPPSSISYILTSTQGTCSRVDTVKVNVSNASAYAGLDKHICLGDSVRLDGVATGSFTWQPTTAMKDTTQIKPYVKPISDTKYILKATLGSCVQRDTVEVLVNQVLANAGKNQIVCLGDSVQLQAVAIGNVTWQPSTFLDNPSLTQPYCKPTTNIDYILTATNGTCVKKDTVSVKMFTNSSTNAGADQRICAGAGVLLNATTASTYEWTPAYFITNSNSQTPFVNPPVDTTYYLKISVGSCIGFDTVKVKVVPVPTVKASDDTKVCLGDSVQLNAQVSNPSKWVWRSQVQLSDSSILNPKAKIAQHSVFIIIVSDTSKLCFASDTMIVDPYPVVKAIYSADNYSGEGQLKPVFDNTSQNATKYTWLFGDSLNTSSKDKNPDFTFIRPGVYKVKLLAQNDYGCKDSITKEFTVLPAGKLYIPNAFTPNGDMYNEVFKFFYTESAYKRVEMTIYNRWGGFIYETSMPGGKWWDGTFEGVPCSEDVYFYVAKAIKINGEISDYHGTITLLR